MFAYAMIVILTVDVKHGKYLLMAGGMIFAALSSNVRAGLDARLYARIVDCKPAVGDIVFIRIGGPVFSNVAATTQTWTSHVGIIVDYENGDWIVAESGVPFVRKTPLHRFLNRSVDQKFSIRRLNVEPSEGQKRAMLEFANSQMGRPYSLGFNLQSRDTFCSKFVHDVVYEGTHQSIGEVETFDSMLRSNPNAPLWFWRAWFLGNIPWQRTTITPASELKSPLLRVIAENHT
jgi:Permuted papain-like amidase enzyme, YaeF/YiiX, C92 family